MSERVPSDVRARQQAVDPTRSFIVQAPAGSGKTSLLTDRIIALLARVERPEQIVAMTFTRKAAGEMHSRVMEKLHLAHAGPQPDAPNERQAWHLARAALEQNARLGWNILEQPSRLRIQTIDSFCASLVKSMPWFSSLGGMPSISVEPRRIYQSAAAKVIELAGQYESVDALLRHLDLDVQGACDAIADMLAKRDQWLPLLAHARHESAADLLQDALRQTIAQELSELVSHMPPGWQLQLAEPARMAAACLVDEQAHSPIIDLLEWQPGDLTDDPDQLPQWRALASLLLTAQGVVRARLDKRQGCPPKTAHKDSLTQWLQAWSVGEPAVWCEKLGRVLSMPEPYLSQAQADILRAQADVLLLAVAQLQLEFTERAEVDFIEVSQRATMALGRADDPSDLLLRLDQQIQHLLVDEFQDTSKAQLDLLETLTSGWQQGDGRTLFVVGDPMQSIYRFRKAEVGLFLKAREQGIGPLLLEPLTLTENFRSSGSVVQWVNEVFSQVLPQKDSEEMGAIRYSPSIAWHPPADQPAIEWHLQFDESSLQDHVVQLATEAWQRHQHSDKPVAILVRSRAHLGNVTLALRQAGVPTRAVDLEVLAQRPIVIDLLALARALAHPGDRAAWISVLRAPWCGLTLASLHTLLWKHPRQTFADVLGRWLDNLDEQNLLDVDQRDRLLAVAPLLLAATHDDGQLPFAARVESLWRALDGPLLLTESSDLDDAQALFSLMDQLAEHSHLDMDLLSSQLRQLFAQPAASLGRAIEVMTMHKAKGLEFESVILMGLDRSPKADQAPLVRIEQVGTRVLFGPVKPSVQQEQDPVSLYLGERELRRQTFEIDRLLYVAATRARQNLHLVARVSVDPKTGGIKVPAARSLLSRIWGFCPAELQQHVLAQVPDQALEQTPDQPQWVGPVLLRRKEPQRSRPPVQLHLFRADPADSGMAMNTVWATQDSSERLVGTLLHAWFAHYVSTGERHVPNAELIRLQLARLGLSASKRDAAADQVARGLDAMLSSERGQWLLSHGQARVEWSLIDSDEVVCVLDLAIDQDSHWLVVDYKTARMRDDETQAQFERRMIDRYREQMQRYVSQLRALDGRPARAALYLPLQDIWIEMPATDA